MKLPHELTEEDFVETTAAGWFEQWFWYFDISVPELREHLRGRLAVATNAPSEDSLDDDQMDQLSLEFLCDKASAQQQHVAWCDLLDFTRSLEVVEASSRRITGMQMAHDLTADDFLETTAAEWLEWYWEVDGESPELQILKGKLVDLTFGNPTEDQMDQLTLEFLCDKASPQVQYEAWREFLEHLVDQGAAKIIHAQEQRDSVASLSGCSQSL